MPSRPDGPTSVSSHRVRPGNHRSDSRRLRLDTCYSVEYLAGQQYPTQRHPYGRNHDRQHSPSEPAPGSNRALLAYFSRPGENYFYGDRIDLDVGNTQVVAEMIAAAITVDTFRIFAADPYPDDYEQTVARNVREEQEDARPEIADPLPDLDGYETILLGSPVWNSRPPMIMRTFLDGVDLTGRTVHPFVTHAVSGMGRVRRDYVDALPDSTVTDGLAVQGETATDAGPEVRIWLRQLDLLAS